MINRLKLITIACAAILGLAACSSGGSEATAQSEDSEQTAASEDAAESSKNAEVQDEIDNAAGENADEIEIDSELDVIASRKSSVENTEVELELNTVRASGELLTVMFTVRNVGEERWIIGGVFDSGQVSIPLADDGGDEGDKIGLDAVYWRTTDGVTVTDNVNGQVYRAAYDTSGRCLCSSGLASTGVEPGSAVVLSTRFAAPPQDVDAVTIEIPSFGTFDDVPIQR